MTTSREQRGLEIANQKQVIEVEKGKVYAVPSQQNKEKFYLVRLNPYACTCADFAKNGGWCKHIWAVVKTRGDIIVANPQRSQRKTYRQNWPAYNAAQCHEKDHFQVLLHDLCRSLPNYYPHINDGRPRLNVPDIMFAMVFKVYSTLATRRFMCDFDEAFKKGYISEKFSYNTILNYFGEADLSSNLEELITLSALPLKELEPNVAVDSTGISTERFKRWVFYRDNPQKDTREWLKLHLLCGVRTNVVIRAIVTHGGAHDSPHFKKLLEGAAKHFTIDEVYADKAYSSVANLQKVIDVGGFPYIPFKENATEEKGGLWEKMLLYYKLYREEFSERYGQRNNVESTVQMIKSKFGGRVRSRKSHTAQNEILAKVLCHNICCLIQSDYELGVEVNFGNGQTFGVEGREEQRDGVLDDQEKI